MRIGRRQFSAYAALIPVSLSARADVGKAEGGPVSPPVHQVDANELEFTVPGSYRLVDDIVVHRHLLDLTGHGGARGGDVITLFTGGVALDLGGHAIAIHDNIAAIALNAQSNRELAAKFGDRVARADSRFVTLKNGTVDLSGDDRGNNGVSLIDAWTNPARMRMVHGADTPGAGIVPKDIAYTRNEYRLEKLKVLSRGVSVAVEGAFNVIRDCVIESAGNAAIFAAGPNVLIENCEIRLRPLVEGQDNEGAPLRAAIVLRDGSNAIIRNNRIRVDTGGLSSNTRCILVRDGATNVVVQNNTFVNVEGETITTMEDAQVVDRGNTLERRLWPW